jgi:type IV secretory pathway TrbL component
MENALVTPSAFKVDAKSVISWIIEVVLRTAPPRSAKLVGGASAARAMFSVSCALAFRIFAWKTAANVNDAIRQLTLDARVRLTDRHAIR